jgi:putative DNA primase/helicase
MSRARLLRKIEERPVQLETFAVSRMSDVEPEDVSWLWAPYIPSGKLTMLEGDPGVGKSWITARLARDVSLGEIPGINRGPENVLIFTAEDGLADTLRPRLDMMGADVSRILAVDAPLDLAARGALDLLEATIVTYRPALVTIDPIVAYVGGKLDIHRANEVRSILAPLARIAEQTRVALLLVRHLSKARSGRALHAGLGSVDFTAAARSALLAGSAGDDSGRFAIVHTKSNLEKAGESLGYMLGENGLQWTGASELRAADLLGAESGPEEQSERAEAASFLEQFLATGEHPAAAVREASGREGISVRTLHRAAKALGVEMDRRGFGPGSVWRLPPALAAPFAPPFASGPNEQALPAKLK